MSAGTKRWLPATRKIHRWAGLFALGWLAILSITGIVLTHPEWRWPHRVIVPGLPAPALKAAQHGHDRVSLIAPDPSRQGRFVVGGVAGLWQSTADNRGWTPVIFAGSNVAPQVFRLLPDPDNTRLWIASDSGIWCLRRGDPQAVQVALRGSEVSALDLGPAFSLMAIVNQSDLYRVDRTTGASVLIDLSAAPIAGLPLEVSVNRWGFDLHLGTGFFAVPFSRFVNDIAGTAMIVLAISGFLYWWLPRRWKSLGKAGPTGKAKRNALIWLFRSHAVIAGVIVFVPLVYLSATGVFLDHKLWFQSWSPQLRLPLMATTGNYRLASHGREILGLATFPDKPERLVLQTRIGFLESDDYGKRFRFDHNFPLDLATGWTRLRYLHVGRVEIVGELIGRNYWREAGTTSWHALPKLPGYIPLSATALPADRIALRTYAGLAVGTPSGGFAAAPMELPASGGLDLTYLFRTIHGLLIFDRNLIWFNDAVAIASVILMFSGLFNWLSRNRWWG